MAAEVKHESSDFPPCCKRAGKDVPKCASGGEMSIKMQVPRFQQKSSRITISFYYTIPALHTHTQRHTQLLISSAVEQTVLVKSFRIFRNCDKKSLFHPAFQDTEMSWKAVTELRPSLNDTPTHSEHSLNGTHNLSELSAERLCQIEKKVKRTI